MLKILFFSLCLSVLNVQAEDDHGHAHEKADEHKEDHKDEHKVEHKVEHKDEHKEDHKDEHKDEHAGEHKEEGHDDHGTDGFKLGDNVIKNFGLKMIDYKGASVTLPKEAIFRGLSEINIYRLRQGLYKRIDFKTLEKTKSTITLSSSDLALGDKIVVDGIGFLRIAEIAASGGISDSHSH